MQPRQQVFRDVIIPELEGLLLAVSLALPFLDLRVSTADSR